MPNRRNWILMPNRRNEMLMPNRRNEMLMPNRRNEMLMPNQKPNKGKEPIKDTDNGNSMKLRKTAMFEPLDVIRHGKTILKDQHEAKDFFQNLLAWLKTQASDDDVKIHGAPEGVDF